jgi:multiple sugar transport system permease protein
MGEVSVVTVLDEKATARPVAKAPAPSRRRRRVSRTPYLFLAPGLLAFTVLVVYPLARVAQMSLYHWNIVVPSASQWLGLGNYEAALHTPIFWRALANSTVYMLGTVPLQIVLGLAVAVLLHSRAPARPLFRVLFYLPVVTSWVVVTLLFKFIFGDQGLVNWFLMQGHVTSEPVSWLGDRWTAMVALCALGVWKGIGWSMVIFLAALQGVPRELEESAAVDGANARQRFRHVSLPMIRPALVFVTVMLVIGGLNVFLSVMLMTEGGPQDSTQVLLTLIYEQAFTNLDFGSASAVAMMLAAVVFVVSWLQLRVMRSGLEDVS